MSVIAMISDSQGTNYKVLSKGAPEVLAKCMKEKPADYES